MKHMFEFPISHSEKYRSEKHRYNIGNIVEYVIEKTQDLEYLRK
jgi:hypothetical protein